MRPQYDTPLFRTCLICSGRTTNAYFGVDACRACAAFFKRAILQKKKYICRTGKGQCIYRKHQQFTCRRCRLDTCLTFGMRLVDEASMPSTSSASRGFTDSSWSLQDIKPKREPLLERIRLLYDSYMKRRTRSEYAIRDTTSYRERFAVSDTTGEKIFISPCEFEHDITPISSAIFIDFLQKAFPGFNELSQPEQRTVFKNALGPVLIHESFYYSYMHFPKQPNRFYMLGPTAASDRAAPEDYLPVDMPRSQKKELARNMTFYFEEGLRIMEPVMRNANMSETEFVAVVALLTWTLDSHIFSETIVDLGDRMKRAIICDLSRHYRVEGTETECSTRIGTLMTIVHALQEGAGVMEEEYQIYSLLELFDESCYVKKTLA